MSAIEERSGYLGEFYNESLGGLGILQFFKKAPRLRQSNGALGNLFIDTVIIRFLSSFGFDTHVFFISLQMSIALVGSSILFSAESVGLEIIFKTGTHGGLEGVFPIQEIEVERVESGLQLSVEDTLEIGDCNVDVRVLNHLDVQKNSPPVLEGLDFEVVVRGPRTDFLQRKLHLTDSAHFRNLETVLINER